MFLAARPSVFAYAKVFPEGRANMVAEVLFGMLVVASTVSRGQEPMPMEHQHEQQKSTKSTDPEQQHSQHDMSNMAGMDHSAMDHSGMNSSGMFLMNESSGTGFQPSAWPMPMIMT